MMNHECRPGVNENRVSPGVAVTGPSEPARVAEAVAQALGKTVIGLEPCAGGDINRAFRLELEGGEPAFLKCRAGAGPEEFNEEAAGLAWLREPGALPVPEVLAVVEGTGWAGLVLEWIETGTSLPSPGEEEELGRGLAAIHIAGADRHGGRAPGSQDGEIRFAGATLAPPPPGRPELGFAELYAIRIEALARQALDTGGIDRRGASAVSALAEKVDSLSGPPVRPARLHGDLWSGNVISGGHGAPWLIDPAAYGGHPEIDLAMLELFGSPSSRFYRAYEELSPLPEGRRDRTRLWQIQPLLVHAVLFGGHYGNAAESAAESYLRS